MGHWWYDAISAQNTTGNSNSREFDISVDA